VKARELIARLDALRDSGALDEWESRFVGSLVRQAARGTGLTPRQRDTAIKIFRERDPEAITRKAHMNLSRLSPDEIEHIHSKRRRL
jgi:hypothetical protein